MSAEDWLELLKAEAPRLRAQRWAATPEGALRNSSGQCPLCALAQSGTEGWHMALRYTFGDSRGAADIALAADDSCHPLRKQLEDLLCVNSSL